MRSVEYPERSPSLVKAISIAAVGIVGAAVTFAVWAGWTGGLLW